MDEREQRKIAEKVYDPDPEKELENIEFRLKEIKSTPYFVHGELFDPRIFAGADPYGYKVKPEWKLYMSQASKRGGEVTRLNRIKAKNQAYIEQQTFRLHHHASKDIDFARDIAMKKHYYKLHGKLTPPKEITEEMLCKMDDESFRNHLQSLEIITKLQNSVKAGLKDDIKIQDAKKAAKKESRKRSVSDLLSGDTKKSGVKKSDAFSVLEGLNDKN